MANSKIISDGKWLYEIKKRWFRERYDVTAISKHGRRWLASFRYEGAALNWAKASPRVEMKEALADPQAVTYGHGSDTDHEG